LSPAEWRFYVCHRVLDLEGVESPVELARKVAPGAPSDLPIGEAFGSSLLDVGRVSA
jgi:hypothetical protein